MADPISGMMMISMGTQVAGGIMGAMGAQDKGAAQARMYQYRAAVAQMNKEIALQNADYAISAGESEAQRTGMAVRSKVGTLRAVKAASGLDGNRGSAERVITSQQEVGRHDVAMVRHNAAKRAYGFEVEARQHEAQAGLDMMGANYARQAADIEATASILGTVSSVSNKWAQAKVMGMV